MATDLSPDQREKLTQLVFARRKIEAIKELRNWTGLGLKESKDIIDRMEEDLRAAQPERFPQTQGPSMVMPAIAVAIFVAVTAVVIYFLFH